MLQLARSYAQDQQALGEIWPLTRAWKRCADYCLFQGARLLKLFDADSFAHSGTVQELLSHLDLSFEFNFSRGYKTSAALPCKTRAFFRRPESAWLEQTCGIPM